MFWCYLFINYYDLRIAGAAMALNLTYFINLTTLEILVRSSESFKDTYISIDSRAFKGWYDYLEVGFYSAILECLTWWNLNICFMFSGYLGVH